MITPKQKKEYLKSGKHWCPWCKSAKVECEDTDPDDQLITDYWYCRECRRSWAAVYTLTNIEEVFEDV